MIFFWGLQGNAVINFGRLHDWFLHMKAPNLGIDETTEVCHLLLETSKIFNSPICNLLNAVTGFGGLYQRFFHLKALILGVD
jgi:hypothetical protein